MDVAKFEAFDHGNDPYGEHDFGAIQHGGVRHFWKIDYYDRDFIYASPDPADPTVTARVLTIMRAEDYWQWAQAPYPPHPLLAAQGRLFGFLPDGSGCGHWAMRLKTLCDNGVSADD